MATVTLTRPQATKTNVSITLVRIAAVRNPDNLGGTIAQEVSLKLTAESVPQLNAMVNIAAVDGWKRKSH